MTSISPSGDARWNDGNRRDWVRVHSSNLHPHNYPYHLLSCYRVHNPNHHQPGHPDEKGPEDFLRLLVLPEGLDRCIRVRLVVGEL
jgi:hypothetical protein